MGRWGRGVYARLRKDFKNAIRMRGRHPLPRSPDSREGETVSFAGSTMQWCIGRGMPNLRPTTLFGGPRMTQRRLQADYVILGAGAGAMAFADTLLTDTDASILLVDLRL